MTLLEREGHDVVESAPPMPTRKAVGVGFILRKMIWGGALIGMLLVGLNGVFSFEMQSGAPQQAAVAGVNCFYMITIYVIARALDQLTRGEPSMG